MRCILHGCRNDKFGPDLAVIDNQGFIVLHTDTKS